MKTTRDYLWPHLRDLPYFRATLRAVEARFYEDFQLVGPTLDLGCGDGHFVSVTFLQPIEVGIDPWRGPIVEAQSRHVYELLVQGDAGVMPFPDGYFGSAFSNSVLEHIPHLDVVIGEAGRVLKPGAYFYFCVPNHQFDQNLSVAGFFDRLGLKGLARQYRKLFDFISRHKHLDSPEVWKARLEANGFTIERYWHYFSPQALHMMEWGHLFGMPSWFWRQLTGRWNLVKHPFNFILTKRIVEKYYQEEWPNPQGVCTFYVARKV